MKARRTLILALLSIALLLLGFPSFSPSAGSGPATGERVTRADFLISIIRESGLSLNNIRFFKAPEVRDVAPDASPGAPYADALIIAGHFGVVENGKPFRPESPVTREEAALMAVRALNASVGSLPVTLQQIIFADEQKISGESLALIQYACKLGLFEIEGSFRPGDNLSAGEWSQLMAAFKKALTRAPHKDGITWELSSDGSSITLYWGEKPTGGYSIDIASVEAAGGTLKVYYRLKVPGPGDQVTQAITYPRATAALPEGCGPFTEILPVREEVKNSVVFRIGSQTYSREGVAHRMDASPFLAGGRALVPVRYLAMSLDIPGDGVTWSPSAGSVTLVKEGTTINIAPGDSTLYLNGRPVNMDVPPVLRQGRVYLPARFVAEALGFTVKWDDAMGAVLINP